MEYYTYNKFIKRGSDTVRKNKRIVIESFKSSKNKTTSG